MKSLFVLLLTVLMLLSTGVDACTPLKKVSSSVNRWWIPSGTCSIGYGGGWTVWCPYGFRQPVRNRVVFFSAVPKVTPPTTCTWTAIRNVLLRPVGMGWVYQ